VSIGEYTRVRGNTFHVQTITCEDIIGWRRGLGTRLIFFISDEEFHFAGEGRVSNCGVLNMGAEV
jgi:hypothetical protein